MLRYLHTLSAVLFYLLAGSFFLALALLRGGVGGSMASWWMQIGDVPLLLSGLLYGATSMYKSLADPEHPSRGLLIAIVIPVTLLFLLLAALNFGAARWF